jgi:hypothetical protein
MVWDDPQKRKVFHGFRSTFIRTLRDENGLMMEQIAYTTGHAPQQKMVASYAGTPILPLLQEFINKLDYGIDFVGMLGR